MKTLVLHSGGLDSTLCLLLASEKGRDVLSLSIDYGQRHRIELEYALAQCHRGEESHDGDEERDPLAASRVSGKIENRDTPHNPKRKLVKVY